jgi:hypothetical protein|tara:strand:+ start:2359 stop:2571 length:213 start_codon:yes stop_codon:yes gene_type:complete
MAFRYHLILFSIFIYSCCFIEEDIDIVVNGWSVSGYTFIGSFLNFIFFITYIVVYGIEYIKRISNDSAER